jgi:hypothetical protein
VTRIDPEARCEKGQQDERGENKQGFHTTTIGQRRS